MTPHLSYMYNVQYGAFRLNAFAMKNANTPFMDLEAKFVKDTSTMQRGNREGQRFQDS